VYQYPGLATTGTSQYQQGISGGTDSLALGVVQRFDDSGNIHGVAF
jgi:hypothetical protein